MQMYLFEAMIEREREARSIKKERGMNIKKEKKMCICPK
jgi:hypothetical protein